VSSKFEYEIIYVKRNVSGKDIGWYSSGGKKISPRLITALNRLGADGWEAVGLGDLGNDSRSEILLKRIKN